MSEDEYDSPEAGQPAGNPGSGRNHTPSHRKGPRFSWNPQYEDTFFRSLCESVKMGLKDNHSFKSEAWDRACTALAERHNAYPNKGHLINKSDNARKKFRLWRGLREDPDFLYNPKTKMVTASEAAWRAHIEVSSSVPCAGRTEHGDAALFRYREAQDVARWQCALQHHAPVLNLLCMVEIGVGLAWGR